MHPRIREIMETWDYCQATLVEVGTLLPPDDAELDQWIGEAVSGHHQDAFVHVVFAAVHLGRRVSSRHLADSLTLMPEYTTMGCVAWHMEGDDVPEQLLAGLAKGGIGDAMALGALLVATAWCDERRGGLRPPELLTSARHYARSKKMDPEPLGLLFALAQRLDDPRMLTSIQRFYPMFKNAALALTDSRTFGERLLNYSRGPMFDRVRETRLQERSGYTMRRAVPAIGRNDPCHCGSGKKHKRCCFDKDQQRLRHSSPVAGKTIIELEADLERHLTPALLAKSDACNLVRLDPRKIAPGLLLPFLNRLADFGMVEAATDAFEKVGCPEELHDVWKFVIWTTAAKAGRKDLAERLLALRGEEAPPREELSPSVQFLLVRDDPAAFLQLLERLAAKAVESKDSEEMTRIAFGVLNSPFRALGILVARSMIPITDKKEAVFLLDQILEARDRLDLSPDDAFSDVIDRRFAEVDLSGGGKATDELRAARRKLEAKAGEVRQMKATLEQLRGEIQRREARAGAAAAASPPIPAAPVDAKTLQELRDKVHLLKSALKERHDERAGLRRALQKTVTELETLRAQPAPAETPVAHDAEEQLVLPGGVEGHQPVRLLEFPRKFHETLENLPGTVSRHAMALLGRLAAGEPAAFAGVVRLRACPATLRVRIGSDYRLLFRLLHDRVEVVDLINRKDLDRRIDSLRAGH